VGSHILDRVPLVLKICGNFLLQGKSGVVGTYDDESLAHDLLVDSFEGWTA
jgi:hypothetical protein